MKKQSILKDKRFFWEVMFLFIAGAILNGLVCIFFNESKYLCFLLLESFWLILTCCLSLTVNSFLNRRAIHFVHMSKRVQELELILENFPASVIGIDKNGAVTFLNKAAEKIMESRMADALGKRVSEFIKNDDESEKQFPCALKNVKSIKETFYFYEVKIKSISSKKHIISGFFCPVDYSAITGALLVFNDETEKKIRENEIFENSDKMKTRYETLRNVFSVLPIGVLVVDTKTSDVVYANRLFRKIHDIAPNMPVSKSTLFKLMSLNLAYRQFLLNDTINRDFFETGDGWFDTSFLTVNKEKRILSINSKINTQSHLKVITVLEKRGRNAHKQLFREMIRDYARVMDSSVDGIVIIDHLGRIVSWSAAMEELTGINKMKALEMAIWEIEFQIESTDTFSSLDERQIRFLKEIRKYTMSSADNEHQAIEIKGIENKNSNCKSVVKIISGIYSIDNEIRVYKIFRNITELAETQKRLTKQKIFMTNLLSATVNMLFIYDLLQKRLIFVSTSIKDTKAELIIYPESSFKDTVPVHPQDKDCYLEYIENLKTAKNNDMLSHIYRAGFAEGEWKWYLRRDIVYCREADGTVRQILGSVTNISKMISSENVEMIKRN